MNNNLFREKSIERVSSPEQLDVYLKVTSPSVWICISAIIILLLGVICWATFGNIETAKDTTCTVSNGSLVCYTDIDTYAMVDDDTFIRVNNNIYEVSEMTYKGQLTEEDAELAMMINMNINDHVYIVKADCDLEDTNSIKGKIVTEVVSPIKFIFN